MKNHRNCELRPSADGANCELVCLNNRFIDFFELVT